MQAEATFCVKSRQKKTWPLGGVMKSQAIAMKTINMTYINHVRGQVEREGRR